MSSHNSNKDIVFSSSSIYLRKLVKDDGKFMYDLMNQQSWLDYIGDKNITNIDAAKAYLLAGPMKDYDTHGFGLYLIVDKVRHEQIGVCGLLKRRYLSGPDIGFAITEKHQHKGFAYQAASLVIDNTSQLTDADSIFATCLQKNSASQNLLRKLGFVYQKVISPPVESASLLLFERVLKR